MGTLSPNRAAQITHVSQHLKNDGLFIFVQIFSHVDADEYQRREMQKDHGFKARYFSRSDLVKKEKGVLRTIHGNEVTLEEMETVLSARYRHCYVTWNSGNFYTLVASNSSKNLGRFVRGLVEPAIPHEYVYGTLPRRFFSENNMEI